MGNPDLRRGAPREQRRPSAVRVRGEPRPAGAAPLDRLVLATARAAVPVRVGGEAIEYLDFIIDGGRRMQALIHDLLVFSRTVTTGRPLEPIDTGTVVAEVTRSLSASIEETGTVVSVGQLPIVRGDPSQIHQVFANLVGNAIKYRCPDRPPEIRITAGREDGRWRFAVQDNGIGIDSEYHDRIFEVFQRLHTQNEYEGTGIGLAVVKRIVERHGGRCWLESAPGEGSTFFFTLPAP